MRMTIGRDHSMNDIVLRHRSVSRTHAVITRDAETARYVIADLRSTNGIRVNGNQYGKVELRAGDYVDLGWVRFRFVAPDELFLFSRDVQVTPLPTGRKRRARRRSARRARGSSRASARRRGRGSGRHVGAARRFAFGTDVLRTMGNLIRH
jgi:pSer/pThr/pTyr-binding forkhead associated (FHA) protein